MPSTPAAARVVGAGAVLMALVVLAISSREADDEPRDSTSGRTTTTVPDNVDDATTVDGPHRSNPPIPDPDTDPSIEVVGGISFTDVTVAAGLAAPHTESPVRRELGMTSGVAVADVDADGDLDVYAPRLGRPNDLYLNDGTGRFSKVVDSAGATGADPSQGSSAAAFADIDADGDLDLYVTGWGTAANALYRNDGGRFVDVTVDAGVALPALEPEALQPPASGNQMHGVTFADFDRDGDLDLLALQWDTSLLISAGIETIKQTGGTCQKVEQLRAAGVDPRAARFGGRSRLFVNDGAGRFTDRTAALGLELGTVVGFTGQFVDVDADGWEDLLVTGDACTSRIWRNDRGRHFVDVTRDAGVGTDENGMGSVVRDIDRDGDPDWFITSISYPTEDGRCPAIGLVTGCSGNRLYVNRGDGTFVDGTDRAGLRHGWWGWGAAIEDFGNDGRLAVAMTNGFDEPGDPDGPLSERDMAFFAAFGTDRARFWLPAGTSRVDSAHAVGFDSTGVSHALVPFDIDRDGDLDLIVGETPTGLRLYRNDTPPGRGWLTVRLDDPTRPGNRQGIGARVEISVNMGDEPIVGWIATDGSYESQRPPEFHVGLADAHRVDRIAVTWPGQPSAQVIDDVDADRVLTIERDDG